MIQGIWLGSQRSQEEESWRALLEKNLVLRRLLKFQEFLFLVA